MARARSWLAAAVVLWLAPSRASAAPEPARGAHRPDPVFRPDRAATAAPGAHVVYFGGRVLSNVEIVMLLWGEGHYAPYVTGADAPSLATFLRAVAGSAYVAGLAEYDTTRVASGGGPGTNQHIGPGTFGGVARLTPSTSADVIDDTAIAAALAEHLARGALPPPRTDAAGNLETLYLVYFPAGKTVTLGRDESCRTFCAYHGAFPWQGGLVPYAVLPDLSRGSGCDLGCGGAEPFANAAAVVTHELAEAITDPDVSAAADAGPPLAWYDPLNGEIGDLCAGELGTVAGTDGVSWPVQKLWSNARGGCVVPAIGAEAAPLVASAAPTPAPSQPSPTTLAAAPHGVTAPRRAATLAIRPALAVPAPSAPLARTPALPIEPSPLPLSRRVRVAIEEENDGLATTRHPTDELYTQGFRVSARWALQAEDAGTGAEVGFAVGQNIYTPSDLRTTDLTVLRHDRPYAGWLYAAFLFRMVGDAPWSLRLGADAGGRGEHVTELEVAAGVTGPQSGGADVQTRFHALLREWSGNPASPPDPAGWSVYQTATQPTIDTSFRHQFDLLQASAGLGRFTARTGAVLGARLSPRVRLDAGSTIDAAGAGLEARVGFVPSTRIRRPGWPFALYGFARADGRYVMRNAFIEGPLRYGVTPLVTIEPWVRDLDVGAVLRLGSLEVGFGQLWRTSEFTPNPPGASRIHPVGQVTVAWAAP